ncbi:MAG: hypothetical protein CM15mP117_07260 [Alphaproteobacteria bacterium]|nr:MAG: hypothetical protein CM15mP117_07260 [Alphaproteobacteria bacterium]
MTAVFNTNQTKSIFKELGKGDTWYYLPEQRMI